MFPNFPMLRATSRGAIAMDLSFSPEDTAFCRDPLEAHIKKTSTDPARSRCCSATGPCIRMIHRSRLLHDGMGMSDELVVGRFFQRLTEF